MGNTVLKELLEFNNLRNTLQNRFKNKIWMDYTNHANKRRWYEIDSVKNPEEVYYPPIGVITDIPRSVTSCIRARRVDIDEWRTFALYRINGFHFGEHPPEPEPIVEIVNSVFGDPDNVPVKCVDEVVEGVRADLLSRSQHGIKKYGTSLSGDSATALRGKLQHAYEEALDLCNYLKWTIMHLS